MPAIFADTTGTGATTGTGTTGTGTHCNPRSGTGVQIDPIVAQETYLTELVRLLSEKKTAYQAARSLSGSLRMDAINAANVKFRTGVKSAQVILKAVKKSNQWESKKCKKEKKHKGKSNDDDDDDHNKKGKWRNDGENRNKGHR